MIRTPEHYLMDLMLFGHLLVIGCFILEAVNDVTDRKEAK